MAVPVVTSTSGARLAQQPTALYVANRGYALFSSRRLLIERLLESGLRVVIATTQDQYSDRLVRMGATFELVEFDRGGISPIRDARAFRRLVAIHRKYKPLLVHHFHAKPLLIGTAAARLAGDTLVVNTITGLGHAFIKGGLNYHLATLGYKFLLGSSDATIFLNRDDRQLFLDRGWIRRERSELIVGSGVDTTRFAPIAFRSNPEHTVLMVARLLWQKGVGEFVEAARLVRKSVPTARFLLAGEYDPAHPDAVPQSFVQTAVEGGDIEFLGYVAEPEQIYRDADVFVLPSYREGVPRVLLEAAASRVPSIAFDVPGCREAILHGVTGFLVTPRSSEDLATAISQLLLDRGLRESMGRRARELAVAEFDLHAVVQRSIEVYRRIGVPL